MILMGTVREVNEMSRYIYAEIIKLLMKQDRILQGNCEYELWKREVDRQVNALPYIDLDDYVPREFHDRTCEEMAKRHQEEIAGMVSVVRCKECKWAEPNREGDYDCKCHIPIFRVIADDYCSYGERREP